MSLSTFGNINPIFQSNDGKKTLTINRDTNNITITNTDVSPTKTIIINSQEFSNGTQVLPYVQMYENINAVEACVFPAPSLTELQVENIVNASKASANQKVVLDSSITGTPELRVENSSGTIMKVRTDSIINNTAITITSPNQLNLTTNALLNGGGYIQAVRVNASNPTTIPSNSMECFVINNASNVVIMNTFSSYLYGTTGGWTCKVVNVTSSLVTITSPDAFFKSWLYGPASATYDIPANNIIQITAVSQTINGLGYDVFMVEDCSGYRTINTTANATYYLNFSDASTSGVGDIQKTAGIECNPLTKTITATTFSGSATGVLTTSDNTNTTCYIAFSKTTAGANTALYLDDITGPLTYNPVSGAIGTSIVNCNRYDATGTTSSGTVFNNVGSGNTSYSNSCTTGSVSIASLAQTTGSVNIGSTTATTGVCSIRPPLVLSRQLRTTNNPSYPPTTSLDLGFQVNTLGNSFTTTSLLASTPTNIYSLAFTSANYGTYLFSTACLIIPNNTTAERQIIVSLSTATATIQTPHSITIYSLVSGNVPSLFLSRVIQIYSDTTIYLVGYVLGSSANVQTTLNNGLFSYVRIA
jgi:hypothetical protein